MRDVVYYQSVVGMLDFVGQLPAVLPAVGVLGGVLYWLLQKKMEATLAQRLEVTKHQLQLDYQRMSIVFEHQRDSFRRVLAAMHETIESIEGGDSATRAQLSMLLEGIDWRRPQRTWTPQIAV